MYINFSEFKIIKGFQNYMINKKGCVISIRKHKNNPTGVPHVMKPYEDKSGYLYVSLIDDNGKKKNKSIHYLVALSFIENPNNYKVVNHKDRNVKNNYYLNLEWCTTAYNNAYTFKHGEKMKGCKCELYVDNEFIKEFVSISEAAKYAVSNFNANYNHLCNFLKENNIVIKRLDLKYHIYHIYQWDKELISFKTAKDCYKYVNSHYDVKLSHKKNFSKKYHLLIVKDNEINPTLFWNAKNKNKTYNAKFYWNLSDGVNLYGPFEGKLNAAKYAKMLDESINIDSLIKNNKLGKYKLIKLTEISK